MHAIDSVENSIRSGVDMTHYILQGWRYLEHVSTVKELVFPRCIVELSCTAPPFSSLSSKID